MGIIVRKRAFFSKNLKFEVTASTLENGLQVPVRNTNRDRKAATEMGLKIFLKGKKLQNWKQLGRHCSLRFQHCTLTKEPIKATRPLLRSLRFHKRIENMDKENRINLH